MPLYVVTQEPKRKHRQVLSVLVEFVEAKSRAEAIRKSTEVAAVKNSGYAGDFRSPAAYEVKPGLVLYL